MKTVEWLHFAPQHPKATAMCHAMLRTARQAGVTMRLSRTYRGSGDVLCLWGPGAPNRWPAMHAQTASGRHVVAWDLSYWKRETKLRVSIDAPHPQRWVMAREWPASRLTADRVQMESRWKPDGPVLVAGIGEKAKIQYGADVVAAWERAQIAACQALGRTVYYRRKRHTDPCPAVLPLREGSDVAAALRGVSLVVTWHSNVAVDAIRLGIPVVCKDGAAAAVCGDTVMADLQPLEDSVRVKFLQNLAWFQWGTTPQEATACWGWLREVLA